MDNEEFKKKYWEFRNELNKANCVTRARTGKMSKTLIYLNKKYIEIFGDIPLKDL